MLVSAALEGIYVLEMENWGRGRGRKLGGIELLKAQFLLQSSRKLPIEALKSRK